MSSEIYEETIYGQVLPINWNDDAPDGLMILVDGEEELIVELDKNGMLLMDHVDRWVRAEVLIKEEEDELRIKVKDFNLEDEWDYIDDDNW
ncbi:MAG: hypothetical protein JEY79_10240 [Pseudodesulfovibrio sp.]|nr:hypothetical protein [Pseudodesulfovibrio sp.]